MTFFKKYRCIFGNTPRARLKQSEKSHARHGGVTYTYCPNCSYRIRVSAPQPHHHQQGKVGEDEKPEFVLGTVPEGLPAELLLSNSPAAQVLLTDRNRVQYANKAAIHLLGSTKNHGLVPDSARNEGTDALGLATPPRLLHRTSTHVGKRLRRTQVGSRLEDAQDIMDPLELTACSLEGLHIKELPIDLNEDTRRWINLEQMIENVKLGLRKESERIMQDLDDQTGYKGKDDRFYRKYYDIEDKTHKTTQYYADLSDKDALKDKEEKERQEKSTERVGESEGSVKSLELAGESNQPTCSDATIPGVPGPMSGKVAGIELEMDVTDIYGSNTLTAKQSFPVLIYRYNKQTVTAKVYVSVILPGGGGGASVTAPYTSLSILPADAVIADEASDEFENAKNQRAISPPKQVDTGPSGEAARVLERVTRLKDMILDEMDYYFMCLTPDGNICVTNKATKKLLGVAGETTVGGGIEWITRLDIFREDFSERLPFEEWALNTMMQDGKPVAQMIGMYTQPPNPRRLILQLRGKALWADESKSEMLAALAVVVDQTEFVAREKLAKRRNEIKNGFLKNLERRIKTPISGSIGLLNMVYQMPGLGTEHKDFLENMYRTMNTLMLVVNELSNFSQIEQGKLNLEKTLFSVNRLVLELKKLGFFSFIKENIEFHVDAMGLKRSSTSKATLALGEHFDTEEMSVHGANENDEGESKPLPVDDKSAPQEHGNPAEEDLVVVGDAGKLRGILIFLLSNAFKFTRQGRVTFTAHLEGEAENGIQHVKFEVSDTGVGFSKETLRNLLHSLDEVITSSTAIPLGTSGLGFAIIKSHADVLGAEMGCTSEPDKGSTFYLTVPLELVPDHDKATLELTHPNHNLGRDLGLFMWDNSLPDQGQVNHIDEDGAEQDTRQLSLDGKNILVVEDNWAHQIVTEKRLGMMGCNTKIAVNGESALTLLKKEIFDPDVVLMDLQMPIMDGFQTSQRIRTDPELARFKNVPIIAVTASESDGDRKRAAEVGIDDFILKPLHAEYLKILLEVALRKGMERVVAGKRAQVAPVGEATQKIGSESFKPVAVSKVSTASSARTTQLLPREGDVPELTFTSATPMESEVD